MCRGRGESRATSGSCRGQRAISMPGSCGRRPHDTNAAVAKGRPASRVRAFVAESSCQVVSEPHAPNMPPLKVRTSPPLCGRSPWRRRDEGGAGVSVGRGQGPSSLRGWGRCCAPRAVGAGAPRVARWDAETSARGLRSAQQRLAAQHGGAARRQLGGASAGWAAAGRDGRRPAGRRRGAPRRPSDARGRRGFGGRRPIGVVPPKPGRARGGLGQAEDLRASACGCGRSASCSGLTCPGERFALPPLPWRWRWSAIRAPWRGAQRRGGFSAARAPLW